MNKKLLTLLFVLLSLNFYAQVDYKKSYIIDNNGTKTECFIKNKDKSDNPTSFNYKLNDVNSEVLHADIKNVKEVVIGDILIYERATVKLDTSSGNLQNLKPNREPEWKEVTVFLKALVKSDASLYEYKKGYVKRYFYRIGNGPIEQLICKKYIVEENSATKVVTNNDFQKQLWQNLNCNNANLDDVLKLKYFHKNLTKYFVEYNVCKNNTIVDFGDKKDPGSINVKVLAGVTSSSLSLDSSLSTHEFSGDLGTKVNLTVGAEFEWIMPVFRNKWSVFVTPTYNSYKGSTTITIPNAGPFTPPTEIREWNASLSHIDIAFGFKYYMFLNDHSKIFLAGSFITTKVLDSDIHNDNGSYQQEAKFENRFGYGIGYNFKNKFNVELKHSSTNIFADFIQALGGTYSSTSLVFGYTVFNNKKKK